MSLFIKVESLTDEGSFEAAVHVDDGKHAVTDRYEEGDQAAFLKRITELFTPTTLVTGEATDVETKTE